MIIPRIPGIREEVRLDEDKPAYKHPIIIRAQILAKNIVPENIVSNRILICKACPKYRPNTDVCGVCGCGAVIEQRSRSIVGKCPEGKWDL